MEPQRVRRVVVGGRCATLDLGKARHDAVARARRRPSEVTDGKKSKARERSGARVIAQSATGREAQVDPFHFLLSMLSSNLRRPSFQRPTYLVGTQVPLSMSELSSIQSPKVLSHKVIYMERFCHSVSTDLGKTVTLPI